MSAVEGWKSKPLLDVLALTIDFRGRTPKKLGMEWGDGDIPALSANNVAMGRIDLSKECYFGSDALYRKWMTGGDVRMGDIVLTMEAPLGNVAQIPDGRRYILSQRTILLRANDSEIGNDYLFHYLSSELFQRIMRQHSSGTTATGIQRAKLETLPITFPTYKPEQTKIAEILTTVDRVVEQTERLIAKQQRINTGLMQDLLSRGIDEHGNLRSEQTHKFKDSAAGRIPVEWAAKPLSSVVDLKVGYAFKSKWFSEDGIPLLRGENVGTGRPDWGDRRCLSVEIASKYEEYQLNPGSIVIGMDRTFTKQGFKVSLLEESDTPCLLVQRVGSFVPTGVPRGFMRLLIQSPTYQRALLLNQKGMDIPHLSKSEILAPLVPVPAKPDEMNAISSRMESLLSVDQNNMQRLAKLRRLKAAMMQDLLTGTKRVDPLLKQEAGKL